MEADETFFVNISNAANAAISDGQGVGTITNDDAPSVLMTSTAADPTNVSPIPVTVTFSESVIGFLSTEITVGNGAVSNFSGSGAIYTFDLIPTASGLVTADIAAGAATALGNGNTVAPQFSRTYDDAPPIVGSTTLALTYKNAGPTSFTINFSKEVNNAGGGAGSDDAANPANYRIINKGGNGSADTGACNEALAGDDTQITVSGVTYIPNTAVVTLAAPLPVGKYRLSVCGTTSIVDLAGNHLNNGADSIFEFIVTRVAAEASGDNKEYGMGNAMPNTGFAPNVKTTLPSQPSELAYTKMNNLWLEIPSQNVKANIVGVPQSENVWDVKWLAQDAGWLAGSAFPTWAGNSIITAHVTDSNGLPGPFANLKDLRYGDQIIIHLDGQQYVFELRDTRLTRPETTAFAFEHLKDNSYLTLITCQDYAPDTNAYRLRRVIRAVLVEVK